MKASHIGIHYKLLYNIFVLIGLFFYLFIYFFLFIYSFFSLAKYNLFKFLTFGCH